MKSTTEVIEDLKVELADLEAKEKKLYKALKSARLGEDHRHTGLLQIQMDIMMTYIAVLRERIRDLEAE